METFIWAIVMMVVSYLLTPKPKVSNPAASETVDVSYPQEGESIVVLFGTRDINASSVVWYGHIKSQAVYS